MKEIRLELGTLEIISGDTFKRRGYKTYGAGVAWLVPSPVCAKTKRKSWGESLVWYYGLVAGRKIRKLLASMVNYSTDDSKMPGNPSILLNQRFFALELHLFAKRSTLVVVA